MKKGTATYQQEVKSRPFLKYRFRVNNLSLGECRIFEIILLGNYFRVIIISAPKLLNHGGGRR